MVAKKLYANANGRNDGDNGTVEFPEEKFGFAFQKWVKERLEARNQKSYILEKIFPTKNFENECWNDDKSRKLDVRWEQGFLGRLYRPHGAECKFTFDPKRRFDWGDVYEHVKRCKQFGIKPRHSKFYAPTDYTGPAIEYAKKWGVELVDGKNVLKLYKKALPFKERLEAAIFGMPSLMDILLVDLGIMVEESVKDGVAKEVKGVVPAVFADAQSPIKISAKPNTYSAQIINPEQLEVARRRAELKTYVSELLNHRLDATIKFGQNFSFKELGDYSKSVSGPTIYVGGAIAIDHQYALANVDMVDSETDGKKDTTGFNLAFFGEPGTGKTHDIYDLILGNETETEPAHGIPGINIYAGTPTPAKFIEIAQFYDNNNLIIPEFRDWFKYPGMVEPLKLAMERKPISYKTKHEVIGPYQFNSFFSVNYNVEVDDGGDIYTNTINDTNFRAIEDRMLCILQFLSPDRYNEIVKAKRKKRNPEMAAKIRDHLTLVYVIESAPDTTANKLLPEKLRDDFKPKPIYIMPEAWEKLAAARAAVLEEFKNKRVPFSPRLETRALQLGSGLKLMEYFRNSEPQLFLDGSADFDFALRIFLDEAAVRSRGAFNSKDKAREIGLQGG